MCTEFERKVDDCWVAGVDGYRDGWIVVLWHVADGNIRHEEIEAIDALLDLDEAPVVIGVDMVIGLPDRAQSGGRACDRAARSVLGPRRGTSVFSPPAYTALQADSYEEAQRLNRASAPEAPGLSRQSYHLFPKMRAVASLMTPDRQSRIREVHPELSFYAMNDDLPIPASKHSPEGQAARLEVLEAEGMPSARTAVQDLPAGPLTIDDVLDAYAACWTARRIQAGTAERCPPRGDPAPRNERGLRMEIWR